MLPVEAELGDGGDELGLGKPLRAALAGDELRVGPVRRGRVVVRLAVALLARLLRAGRGDVRVLERFSLLEVPADDVERVVASLGERRLNVEPARN